MVAARFQRFTSAGALRAAICAAGMLAGAAPCVAQQPAALTGYPVKPIRIIVASSPGTASDFFARSLGEELDAFYGRRVVIENRAGAGGLIGNTLLSKANADGYTLGMVDVTRIITELMRDQPPYRALADIATVIHVASITNVLAVAPSIPARTAPEFVAYVRARVGELNYASLGIGSASHLAGEVFTRAVGADAVHVPYRNLSDSIIEKGLGRVHYSVFTLPAVLATVREGRMRALAVMTRQRSPALPGVPAIAEVGLPEAQVDSWSGIVAPRGTPRRIVEQLHGDLARAAEERAARAIRAPGGRVNAREHAVRLHAADAGRVPALPGADPRRWHQAGIKRKDEGGRRKDDRVFAPALRGSSLILRVKLGGDFHDVEAQPPASEDQGSGEDGEILR